MNHEEKIAMRIADKYKSDVSQLDKLKHLGQEFTEFVNAVVLNDKQNMKEEAGDIVFLVLHILHKAGISDDEINCDKFLTDAYTKMQIRNSGKLDKVAVEYAKNIIKELESILINAKDEIKLPSVGPAYIVKKSTSQHHKLIESRIRELKKQFKIK